VNPDRITKDGNNIIQLSNEFSSQIKSFESIIDKINSVWEGQDSLQYINTMKEKYVVGLKELNDVILNYGNYLKNVSISYKVLDQTFATKQIDV
jgi:uncharacterized protein YukE